MAIIVVSLPALLLLPLLAFWRDKELHDRDPSVMGFKWGYFTGFRVLFVGVIYLFVLDRATASGEFPEHEVDAAEFWVTVVLFVPGVFILMRRRWAWVLYTIGSMNPALWMINGIYIKNRWEEIGAESARATMPTKPHAACPRCGNKVTVPSSVDVSKAKCPSCGAVLTFRHAGATPQDASGSVAKETPRERGVASDRYPTVCDHCGEAIATGEAVFSYLDQLVCQRSAEHLAKIEGHPLPEATQAQIEAAAVRRNPKAQTLVWILLGLFVLVAFPFSWTLIDHADIGLGFLPSAMTALAFGLVFDKAVGWNIAPGRFRSSDGAAPD